MISRQELFAEFHRIPAFPGTLLRLSEVVLSGSYTIDDVVDIVMFDQVMTADAIRYSNSAESGSARSISTLQDAVVRMGGSRLLRYLLTKWFYGSITKAMSADDKAKALWQHGVYTAVASEVLGEKHPQLQHEHAFTASLLHDIGIIPLVMHADKRAVDFFWELEEDTSDKEVQIFGFSHAEVGAMLLDYWNFPVDMIDAVRFHSLGEGGPQPLSDMVRISNYVAKQIALKPERRHHSHSHLGLELTPAEYAEILQMVAVRSQQVFDKMSG